MWLRHLRNFLAAVFPGVSQGFPMFPAGSLSFPMFPAGSQNKKRTTPL
jgi:hypothetical protein